MVELFAAHVQLVAARKFLRVLESRSSGVIRSDGAATEVEQHDQHA